MRQVRLPVKEKDIQAGVESYLIQKQYDFIRVPDAVYRVIFSAMSIPLHIKGQISSFLKGLPDLQVVKKYRQYNLSLFIELKTKRGKLSQGQKKFARQLNVVVCRSVDEAIKEIEQFMEDKDGLEL
jgi:hypothetical protein